MYLRNFETVFRSLAEQGHQIHLTTSIHDRKVPPELQKLAQRLADDFPNVTYGITYERADWWAHLAMMTHGLRNLMRYRRPEYANAPALVERAEKRVNPVLRRILGLAPFRARPVVKALTAVFTAMDRAIPYDKTIIEELRRDKPDALIVTPMVDLGSEQVDWVRAARAAEVPSCLLVASWDNLTNKGLIQARPDRVVVWNEFQKQEAVEMHGIPAADVVATGAQLYDHWFERGPSRDYETFCAQFGFDASKPTLLYCGSSIFIARNEAEFVQRWLKAVRGSTDEAVRTANIMVRPHPMHQVPFDDMDVSEFERVTIHPRSGGMPVLEDGKADYYDSLYHCAAVVGINTSALIEAATLGKRSFTVTDPKYAKTQEGTLHFRYLTEGGILRKASSFDEHIGQLSDELAGRNGSPDEVRVFVERFVRPHGLDKAATPIVAETVLQMPGVKPHTERQSALRLPLTALLAPVAALLWLGANGKRVVLDFLVKVLRRGLFFIARVKRKDGIDLLALTMPLDYEKKQVAILATSPKESVTRTRSVMKEPWTVHWIENVVKPGDVFYDIGANVGAYSLVCSKAHDDQVTVYSFEPGFNTYAALCRNIIHNGCGRNITPIPTLLLDRMGTTVFKYRSTDSGSARHAVGEQGLATKDFKETKAVYEQPMLSITLDHLVETFGAPAPTHVKLDVDGPELEILKGGARTLSSGTVQTIMVELDEKKNRKPITELLESYGFKLAREFDKRSTQPSFDAFFARDVDAVAAIMEKSPTKPAVEEK